MSLQLDAAAQAIVGELVEGLENEDGWIKMTARIAAQIDSKLNENGYVGIVTWFSDEDYIESDIVYS
ncbi:hypothetical protein [Vibrio methylphosphonaticus]|uniref:hypothetical protein n=1 Tax=Vibrio methylphosphonaticus TaxID=2946866 RepID=UPI00202A1AEB|nr:hypothetical protein [Vibrio methylphosphonaticus]MCL9777470.1 hypothetical protein [Vibrio methylphosphonaticus]